ncbi:MAG: glycosyltransferase [Candidatus Pacearchaeota archaeon]
MTLNITKETYETVVLIPSHNGAYLLEECLSSLKKQTYKNFKIVVIDNASTDNTEELIDERFPEVKLLFRDKNDGFVKSMNEGIRYVIEKYNPKYIAPLNNDAVVNKDWLKNLVNAINSEKNIAAVASNMFFYHYPNVINSQGCIMDKYGRCIDINIFKKINSVGNPKRYILGASWGAALISIEALNNIGLLDEKYYSYYEDLDWGWRANLMGYKCIFEKKAIVYHKFSASWKNNNYKKVYLCKRNAIRAIIKNYELKNLLNKLPIIFIENLSFSIKSLYSKRLNNKIPRNLKKQIGNHYGIKYALIPLKSLFWNLYNLRDTLKERKKIQSKRKIEDNEIHNLIERKIFRRKRKIFRRFIYQPLCNLFDLTIAPLIGEKNTFILVDKVNIFYDYIFPSRKKQRKKVKPGEFGVNILGYLNSESGLGECARSLVKEIQTTDIPHVINNYSVSPSTKNNKEFEKFFKSNNPYPINVIMIMVDRFEDAKVNIGKKYFYNKYIIPYWFWELEKFPRKGVKILKTNNIKEVWVPTEFVKNSLRKIWGGKILVVHPCIDFKVQEKYTRHYLNIPEDKFIFLFMFDYFSIIERKNPIGLIKSFRKAFGNKKDVMLVIKCANSHAKIKEHRKLILEAQKTNNIKIIDYYLSREETHGLTNCCDCYVSLHRGEGFGLTMAEAMYLGKPVIATKYSGNLDFMNDKNSFLVDNKLVQLKRDYLVYKKDNFWAEPNISQAAKFMRYVYENREKVKIIAEQGKKDIRTKFSPKAIGKIIKKRLDKLETELKTERYEK